MNTRKTNQRRTTSPCVRNCCLDEQDICIGCFRSVEEICAWSAMSTEQQLAVIELARARKKQH
ncbi:MAG: DUF1289 domain-containing protein [Oceanospirillaceae bacterium]